MARVDKVIASANRAADKEIQETKKTATQLTLEASAHGVHGGSRHLVRLKENCLTGFANISEAVKGRIFEYDKANAYAYEGYFEKLLKESIPKLIEIFKKHGGHAPAFGITSEKEQAELLSELEDELRNFTEEFDLFVTAPSKHEGGRGLLKADVIKVMIASPSDVGAERQIIRDVIHEWNAINTEDREIILMPIGWETHSSPAMGERPQEIINKQILGGCDLLIAVFWTKFGTPTGKAGSGTAEEIEEHLSQGKPALLYFSSEPVVPDSIDTKQYEALKAFEREKMSQGLIERYESKTEFREKLTRQLAQTIIRDFSAYDASGSEMISHPPEISGPPEIVVSEHARELLSEAVKDESGIVMRLTTMSGSHVQTNNRDFIKSNDARTVARWHGAVDELESLGFLEDRNGKGEVFFVTSAGFDTADQLTKGDR